MRGRILFPAGARPARVARVTARVEEVSRADAPAVVIAETVREGLALDDEAEIEFEIRLPQGVGGRQTVRVHVDVSGSGGVTVGDYVSTASHPIPSADRLDVPVRRVGL
ncbi:hypothetical protein Acsp01_49450 [Actinoplanes sp. NBRC 101535]|nr:hypothetical protein Acsp01_49450 [Actinoplanes sp. NBRC 101535]